VTANGYHPHVHTRRPRRSAAIAALLAGLVIGTAVPGAGAAPRAPALEISTPSAATLATLRADLLGSVSADRDSAGLRSLREDPVLDAVAQARAERLAASSEFSHAAAGPDILSDVESTGIEPYRAGEALGWSAVPGTSGALDAIRLMWLASPPHRAILLTKADNYIGVGVATRGPRTFATIVVAETRDRTRPAVRLNAPSRDGTSVTFSWTATDPLLQTRTAGVRSVTVQLRVDEGPWQVVRAACTGSSIVLADRASGHSYSLRVRARDRGGNLSGWTAVQTILVP
jgi:uncharacterized protein YkwD